MCRVLFCFCTNAYLTFAPIFNKREIDFIVERNDGAMLGIEVKSGSALGPNDFKHFMLTS